uniref:Uncharacterized protein n=1 Tax=Arundo donax TaxID=35708 RepID=A0A0A8YAH1_ARUDO
MLYWCLDPVAARVNRKPLGYGC